MAEPGLEEFKLLADCAPVMIWRAGLDRRCDYFNRPWLEFTGRALAEELGEGWTEGVHPDDLDRCWQTYVTSFDRREPFRMEYRLRRADGRYRWILDSGRPFTRDGAFAGFIGSCVDIDDLKQAEREREALQARRLHSQKLESLGVLAGGIAHDFNNLLTAILGNASLALDELGPESAAHSLVQSAVHAAEKAAELTRQLLTYSGRGSAQIALVDLSQLVREIAELLASTLPRGVHLQIAAVDDLPWIEADVAQLQQVVMNLVINAGEAIAARRDGAGQGDVVITTGVIDVDDRFAAAIHFAQALGRGRHVFLEVADTGCGMSEETLARIFDPFFTTKPSGHGLGLSATLGLLRAHRGGLQVSSTPAVGTTFGLFLPASERAPPAPGPSGREDLGGTGTVLVVDDDPMIRDYARAVLERHGYMVLEAADGEAALAIAGADAAAIDVALVDRTLPGIGGPALLEAIVRRRRGVEVLLMSGYDEEEATRGGVAEGLAGFLRKPFSPAQLLEAIRARTGAR